jgi:hypothetical protein
MRQERSSTLSPTTVSVFALDVANPAGKWAVSWLLASRYEAAPARKTGGDIRRNVRWRTHDNRTASRRQFPAVFPVTPTATGARPADGAR